MKAKPIVGIASCRITCVAVVVTISLLVMACSRQPSASTNKESKSSIATKADPTITDKTNVVMKEVVETQQEVVSYAEKTLPKSGIVLMLIPAGTFAMGSPKKERDTAVKSIPEDESEDLRESIKTEKPHKVTLTKAFYLGKYEVTQGQWTKVMGNNPSMFKDVGDDAPVDNVNWHACTNFMEKLATLEKMPEGSFMLPTEAQWEYACRAGTETPFCYGANLDASMANFDGEYPYGKWKPAENRQKTMPVGQFKPNAWGLYDMHGNVEEWCADWYEKYEENTTDPIGPESASDRVIRGGSWFDCAAACRSAYRSYCVSDSDWHTRGFRLCMPAGQP